MMNEKDFLSSVIIFVLLTKKAFNVFRWDVKSKYEFLKYLKLSAKYTEYSTTDNLNGFA